MFESNGCGGRRLTGKGWMRVTAFGAIGLILIIGLIWGLDALGAVYSVWSQGKTGQSELQRADWNRQIAVKEANAKKDAAVLLADAEVERARGVAKANQIIGKSLQNNEAYLRYLWIDNLQNDKNQVIYVPTEANLPILEASRTSKRYEKTIDKK